ncbi:MAG TPA: hypothetical protein VFK07_03730 [Candidatus Paceibacterota bacterium]|nr:hypothetical protein [Candidatus Paceibacterota bacterium]
MLFGLFSKLTRKEMISRKFAIGDDDVYLYVLFPIAVAFLLTFMVARLISHIDPFFYLHIVPGLHIHHYSYGIFVLAISGYLALAARNPRDKYLISLLHGFGLGLAFDEFAIWLKLANDSANRFSYDGVVILIGLFLLLISMESGLRVWRKHFGRKTYTPELASEAENEPTLS